MPFLIPVVAAVASVVAPIAGAVGGAFAATAGFIQGGLMAIGLGGTFITGSLVLKSALLIGAMFIAQALNSPKKSNTSAVNQGAELSLKLDPTMPRQIVLGEIASGGSLVWSFTYTDDNTKPNRYLVRIISLSDIPITGIHAVRDGNTILGFTGDPTTDMVPCNQFKDKNGNPCCYMQFFYGSRTPTASSWVISASGGTWTTNHKGVGQAYVVVRYDYNSDAFPNGEPQLVFDMRGAACYDQRFDSSYGDGRTGSQRLNDPTTWAYSCNTAVVAQQVLRGFWLNNVLIAGSQAENRDLADTMLVAAYNTCDQVETNADSTTEPRYRCGMLLTSATNLSQQLSDLELAMNGNIYDRSGAITFVPGGAQTPVLDLTDADINWMAQRIWQPKGQLNSTYNYVSGQYIDEANAYVQTPYAPRYNGTWETDDGGQRLIKTVNFNAVVHRTQVERATAAIHALSRYSGLVTITCPIWAFQLEQGDWFTFTSARWNFSAKTFVCIATTLTPDMQYVIIGEEVSAAAYDYDAIVQERPNSGSYYQSPGFSLPIPVLTLTPTTIQNADTSFNIPALQIACTNINASSSAFTIDYQLAYFIGTTLTNAHDIGSHSASETTFIWSQNVMPGYQYAVRARCTNGISYGEWSTWYTANTGSIYQVPSAYTIGGKTAAQWQAEIDDIDVQGNTLHDRVLQTISDLWTLSTGVMSVVVNAAADRTYVEELAYLRGQPVGTVIDSNKQAQIDGDTAIVTTMALLGAKSGDGLSWILDLDTVKASPTETLTQRFSQLDSTDAANTAAIGTESSTRATADTATATLISLIGAQNIGGTAFILNSSTAYVDPTTSLSTYMSGVTASLGSNSAAITSLSTATLGPAGGTSLAEMLTSVTSTVSGNTTSITTLTSVQNGILGRWGVAIDSNGHVAGIELLNGTGTTSAFIISAASLAFVDTSGASLQSPFYISGGVVYADTLVVKNLRANTIITAHIQDGQVTQLSGATWSLAAGPGPTTLSLVASTNIDLTSTANTLVHGSWAMAQDGTHLFWGFQVFLDGSAATSWLQFNLAQGVVSFDLPLNGLTSGTHQVDLYISGSTQTVFNLGTLVYQGNMK